MNECSNPLLSVFYSFRCPVYRHSTTKFFFIQCNFPRFYKHLSRPSIDRIFGSSIMKFKSLVGIIPFLPAFYLLYFI